MQLRSAESVTSSKGEGLQVRGYRGLYEWNLSHWRHLAKVRVTWVSVTEMCKSGHKGFRKVQGKSTFGIFLDKVLFLINSHLDKFLFNQGVTRWRSNLAQLLYTEVSPPLPFSPLPPRKKKKLSMTKQNIHCLPPPLFFPRSLFKCAFFFSSLYDGMSFTVS